MELFAREIGADPAVPGRASVIAVTGTNGKSTTTALVGHILAANGFDAQVGGNIGKAVLELGSPNAKTVYVIEVSSYQIDLSPGLVPDTGVLSNITPDHIDRHGTLENYAAVKARLLKQTSKSGSIVIGVDDPHTASIFTRHAANGGPAAVPVSVGKVLGRGVFVVDGALYDAQGQRAAKVMDLAAAAHLPGAHNWQNAALAYAATKPYAKDARRVVEAIADFPGLAHRMEDVGRIGKVRFVNDSKATNADAAARALACYPDIFWIAGGKAKEGGIESLAPFFPRIRKAYLIGEAAASFAATLDGKVPFEISGTLDAAVARRRRRCRALAGCPRRSCCCRRPAPRSTSSRISSSAAMPSAPPSPTCGPSRAGGVMNSRADRSTYASWWWTIDRVALLAMLALIAIGLMLAFAASPAATGGTLTAGDFRYAAKQIVFACIAGGILVGASLLSLRQLKIAAAIVFALALIGSGLVLVAGTEVLGAKRSIELGLFSLQPSEFLKPGFAVLAAAIIADRNAMPLPKPLITFLLILPAIVILMLQPDVGQTTLLLALWAALLFFSGTPLFWMGVLGGGTGLLGGLAYVLFPHVHHRIDQFLNPQSEGYQTGLALKAFAHGGLTGVGPGAGTIKYRIPEAHSDFVFAVAGEEFGLILCGLIAILFCALTVRLLLRAADQRDRFSQLAGAGLAVVTALQAFINMGVAVSLLPAKGMTLPFISYGGSSLFAVALTMGFALAVTRQRPQLTHREQSLFEFLGARA